jgi:hypothetical protein
MLIIKALSLRFISEYAKTHYLCVRIEYILHFLIPAIVFAGILILYNGKNRYYFSTQVTITLILVKEFFDFLFWMFRDKLPPISFYDHMNESILDVIIACLGVGFIYSLREVSKFLDGKKVDQKENSYN